MAKKNKDPRQLAIAAMTRELDSINAQMKDAYRRFDHTCESELIDACIFEIEALRARYTYLIRCIKELSGGPKRAVPQPTVVVRSESADTEESAAAAAVKGGPLCHL